ncbi:HlyD family secretion protein [Mastigocoleus testarum]|uniref:RND transporter n=1 Tax=Mastigocoleus testarum BC008 TaxID=371196 RepID=A0A0V7ZUW4_9CYAN|nr:efflux RND transporter periplasmic adaptor subunit [Mastigocoleus testarum]KST68151.1 RND transporter [Mastigocoleus testarum BC008]KST68814.1 RND transporter [Mastigocoleus testarum BC008]
MKLDSSQDKQGNQNKKFLEPLPVSKKNNKNNWLFWALIICFLVGGSFITYRQLVIIPRREARRNAQTLLVERGNLAVTIAANGTVQAQMSVNVSPESSGTVKSLKVKEGERVKQGQVIAHMDNSNLQGQLIQRKGELAQAEANLQKLIAGNRPEEINQSQAQLEQAKANLQKLVTGNRSQEIAQAEARLNSARATLNQKQADFSSYEQLYKQGAISRETFNQKKAELETAQAQVAEAQQALDLQKVGTRQEEIQEAQAQVKQQQQALTLLKAGTRSEEILQARAQVTSARGSLQYIQNQVDDAIVTAPFDGQISKIYADPGSFVTPTTSASTATSAVSSSILSLSSVKKEIIANVAEANIGKIRLGQKVIIKADAYPQKKFEGKVSQILSEATIEQNVTSFEVKVALVSEEAQKMLLSGMNVEMEFQVDGVENVIVVPSVAVVRRRNATGVYVVESNGKPRFKVIETGVAANGKTEVKAGLKGTEKVLVNFPPGSRPKSRRRGLLPGGGSRSNK